MDMFFVINFVGWLSETLGNLAVCVLAMTAVIATWKLILK